MTEHQFNARLAQINEQYEARREGAVAYRDQEMARLCQGCGWEVRRIARHLTEVTGKRVSKSNVSRRLIFGRFLALPPVGDKPALTQNLTERSFRDHWRMTAGKEAEHLAQVAHRRGPKCRSSSRSSN
jgi:hypothetical protein